MHSSEERVRNSPATGRSEQEEGEERGQRSRCCCGEIGMEQEAEEMGMKMGS